MKVYVGPYPTHSKWHDVIGYYPEQKVSVKIDKWDTWNMDTTLAYIILPMLKQLKETSHTYPSDLSEEQWQSILDEMIFAFKSKTYDWEEEFTSGNFDVEYEEIPGTDNMRMEYGPNHTFKIDKDGMKKVQQRITLGFELFGKYYENLWD